MPSTQNALSRLSSLAILFMLMWPAAHATEITRTQNSPYARVTAMGTDQVSWTDGFWHQRFQTCQNVSVPAMWDLMKGDQYKPFYQHFLIAAGEMPGEHHGAPWNDGDFYKWMEAACYVYGVNRDPELLAILDQAIAAIAKAQRTDGYIHTPVLIRRRNGDTSAAPFQDRHNFEMYNMGHLLTTACIHHRITGQRNLLDVALRTAEFLHQTFENPTPQLARNSVCPSHYMGMLELYRTTREPKHLSLAKKFLAMRNIAQARGDDNQDRIPFVQQREAEGHAVRANYLYAGAADVFLETGDDSFMTALDALWQNVTQKKLYVTGGCGALYDGAAPFGSSQQSTISRIHQAYGHNYQLPNTTAHNETCAAIGNVLWNWRMFLATGESKYMDVLELSLYNSVLSGVSLEGKDYFYVNPLRNTDPLPVDLRWERRRVPFVTSYCCPPNVLRTIAQVHGYAYAKQADRILVNLYGSNSLKSEWNNQPLHIDQQTEYPWDGLITLSIQAAPDEAIGIGLRIPHWADLDKVVVKINGGQQKVQPDLSGYLVLTRSWKAGDQIQLRLPMSAVMLESHPLVEETRNQVAVKRGPLVYCLESTDVPDGIRLHELHISPLAEFTPSESTLDQIRALSTILTQSNDPPWQEGQLYRVHTAQKTSHVRAKLIPYFAWANRGPSEMTVWIPLETNSNSTE